ncbi:MAG: hypothetical protein KDB21_12985, partial [Acidimicrobiales bacterium]|nr:hypothetical protein [Acidimicrobiales bacterium]
MGRVRTGDATRRRDGDRRPLLAFLLVAVLIAGGLPLVGGTASAAPDITAKTHQGQRSDASWTSGNIFTYAEGDVINFRFTLTGNAGDSGTLEVRFTGQDNSCAGPFFDGTFALGSIVNVSGTNPTVTIAGAPTPIDFGTSNGEWVQPLSISFAADGEAVVNYSLRVSDDVAGCNGASQHSRLAAGTGVHQTGQQNVPVPANQIVELPDITVTKLIDRNGDDVSDGPAATGEYSFTLDGTTTLFTDANGQVVFQNVSDGPHTVTESQADTSQGLYTFLSGSGDCTFAGATATTISVAAGTTPTSASCTFVNTLADLPPDLRVTKTPTPVSLPEPGGSFTYTVTVENESPTAATLTALSDDLFGDITQVQGAITATSCVLPRALGGSDGVNGSGIDFYSCTFTATVTGNAGLVHTNTVTATASNGQGTDMASATATVTLTDVPPTVTLDKSVDITTLPEPGGVFTFTLSITNGSAEAVTITSLTDDHALSAECLALVGTSLGAGASTSCEYTVTFVDAGTYDNTATVVVTDDDGSTGTDSDTATATVTGTAPTVSLDKIVLGADTVPEPGGTFTFRLTVTNTSVENVTITALTDSQSGDAADFSACAALVGVVLTPGQQVSCDYDVTHTDAGTYLNTASVTVVDDDSEQATDGAAESVTVTDVLPTVVLTKTVDPASRPEPGGEFTYTLTIENTSPEPITIDALTDDHALSAACIALVGTTLDPGQQVSCTYTLTFDDAGSYDNTAEVTVSDDDQNSAGDTANATAVVTDVAPTITVTKTPDVTEVNEPGANVTFTVLVTNTSLATDPVTVVSLVDSVFGDLTTLAGSDCALTIIAPGGSYECSFTVFVSGDGGDIHTNTVTVNAVDDELTPAQATAEATVDIIDALPVVTVRKTAVPTTVAEPGGLVTFHVVVENDGALTDLISLEGLVDSIHGDLDGQGTCALPVSIVPGGDYSCEFTAFVAGNAGFAETDVITATGADDEENAFSVDDDATVTVTDAAPSIVVTKTVVPGSVSEPGGTVTFSVLVDNTSIESDPVTIDKLTDDVHGDLDGQGTCALPQLIAPGDSYSCEFTADVSGNAGDTETDVVSAEGVDDEGTRTSATDDAVVTVDDVLPALSVDKTASPVALPEPGGTVTFTVVVTNDSVGTDPVELTSLVDDVHGDLDGQGTCSLPRTLAPGENYTCQFTADVTGNAGDTETDVVTATATDDEDNSVEVSDDATVTIADAAAALVVVKDAFPNTVPEPGGEVTFTVSVQNLSSATDPVTIDSLVDDVHGDLNGRGDCIVPQTLAPGALYSCQFTAFVAGDAGFVETDVVTASGTDDDGSPVSAFDDATVTVLDALPTVSVVKTASPLTVPEPGGEVSFSVTVTNTSPEAEPVQLVSL